MYNLLKPGNVVLLIHVQSRMILFLHNAQSSENNPNSYHTKSKAPSQSRPIPISPGNILLGSWSKIDRRRNWIR